VTYYPYNQEENNGWSTASEWPLPNQKLTTFYLNEGSLGQQPGAGEKTTSATVDYDITEDNFWQKGLTFVTAPLEQDVQVTGYPVLKLTISSSVKDTDLVARIDDLAPDGTHRYYMVEGRIRASLRKQADAPYDNLGLPWHPFTKDAQAFLQPGEPVEVEFNTWAMSYIFKKGHQIRLTLNFADKRVTQVVEPAPSVTVYHNDDLSSTLTLPVIPH